MLRNKSRKSTTTRKALEDKAVVPRTLGLLKGKLREAFFEPIKQKSLLETLTTLEGIDEEFLDFS
ncbi:hypothetical protein GM3708_226 [Geminocystis sp. NIES-3708]|uniref:hypothetical protein n=1 Tax=Geminocystis sp. NIES-3708 TaxID=1615909 RepID=UPI0005FC7A6F|nr:hypothetical protein [Geminocystis sp. NIES-3708]BAQ59820.1 hypothetical protein GM3708_226 [Geminocystis sp. NIES-3708]